MALGKLFKAIISLFLEERIALLDYQEIQDKIIVSLETNLGNQIDYSNSLERRISELELELHTTQEDLEFEFKLNEELRSNLDKDNQDIIRKTILLHLNNCYSAQAKCNN